MTEAEVGRAEEAVAEAEAGVAAAEPIKMREWPHEGIESSIEETSGRSDLRANRVVGEEPREGDLHLLPVRWLERMDSRPMEGARRRLWKFHESIENP